MSKADHLKAHASRLLASAERFRHRGHTAVADQITEQATRYLEAAASTETIGPVVTPGAAGFVAPLTQAFPSGSSAHSSNGSVRA